LNIVKHRSFSFSLTLNGNFSLPQKFQKIEDKRTAVQTLIADISIYYRHEIMRAAARRAALFIIARYGEGDLAVFPRDLIKLIANEVWKTRFDLTWMDADDWSRATATDGAGIVTTRNQRAIGVEWHLSGGIAGSKKNLDSDAAADRMGFRSDNTDHHLKMSSSCFRKMRENTQIDLSSDTCYSGTLIALGTRWRFWFLLSWLFSPFCLRSFLTFDFLLTLCMALDETVFMSLAVLVDACVVQLPLKSSQSPKSRWWAPVRHPHGQYDVHIVGLASPTMTHQPIEEGGNGDFSFRPPTSNLSLKRWVETRVVGWGGVFTDRVSSPLLQIPHWDHVDVGLERGQVGAVWKGPGDGLAVEGGPVMLRVRIFVEKAF
jgi:hypothetical protein